MNNQLIDKLLSAELTELLLESRDWTIFLDECRRNTRKIREKIEDTDPDVGTLIWNMTEVNDLIYHIEGIVEEMAKKQTDFFDYVDVLRRQSPLNLDLLENHAYFQNRMNELNFHYSKLKQMLGVD